MVTDASGPMANCGAAERRGIIVACEEANEAGGVLGRQVVYIQCDTETLPETAARVAESMITQNRAAFLIGGIHSGVTKAISEVAQKHGVIYLNTNSSSPTECGSDAHRTKFVWDGSSDVFAAGLVEYALRSRGRDWVLLSSDYSWGRNTAAATKEHLQARGGRVLEEMLVPEGTTDFTPYLQRIRQLNPDVVASSIASGDSVPFRLQVIDSGMRDKPTWVMNGVDWPDVQGLAPQTVLGLLGVSWYHMLELEGVSDFVARYQKRFPNCRVEVPGNVFYNAYMATRELLNAVRRAGTTNNVAVIKELERLKVSAAERMQHHDVWMNPRNHRLEQTLYIVEPNASPKDATDVFRIVSWTSPQYSHELADQTVQLEPYESLPVYEP